MTALGWWRRTENVAALFVVFLGFPAVRLIISPTGPVQTVLAAAGILAFGGLFVVVIRRNLPVPHTNSAPVALVAMAAVSILPLPALGTVWLLTCSYYLVTLCLLALPSRWWLPVPVMVVAADIVISVLLDEPAATVRSTAVQIAGYALLLTLFYWIIELSRRNRQLQAERERGAIEGERLRIARDLHDVLGQGLTGLAMKADLAGRLVDRDPARSRSEIDQIGVLARDMLGELRATLSDYREITIDKEIANATALLDSAGIDVRVQTTAVPDNLAKPLAWLVREGVTNVVRHSRARHCVIRIEADADDVRGSVADDGPEVRGSHQASIEHGNGLNGLAERVATAQGELRSEVADGWLSLTARFPVRQP